MINQSSGKSTATRIPFKRGQQLTLTIDGQSIQAYAGETVATVLLTCGKDVFRLTANQQAPRGLFCGMGVCFDCLVTVNGVPNIRACLTPVAEGMVVETGKDSGE